jgi:hypothetical protein
MCIMDCDKLRELLPCLPTCCCRHCHVQRRTQPVRVCGERLNVCCRLVSEVIRLNLGSFDPEWPEHLRSSARPRAEVATERRRISLARCCSTYGAAGAAHARHSAHRSGVRSQTKRPPPAHRTT